MTADRSGGLCQLAVGRPITSFPETTLSETRSLGIGAPTTGSAEIRVIGTVAGASAGQGAVRAGGRVR
jgi:hypothetical protein